MLAKIRLNKIIVKKVKTLKDNNSLIIIDVHMTRKKYKNKKKV
jgi:hypothetical protein